jgi:hypothetical protein
VIEQMPPWYVDEEAIEEALGVDADHAYEFLKEARREVDESHPRGRRQQEHVFRMGWTRWLQAHWLLFSLERQVGQ